MIILDFKIQTKVVDKPFLKTIEDQITFYPYLMKGGLGIIFERFEKGEKELLTLGVEKNHKELDTAESFCKVSEGEWIIIPFFTEKQLYISFWDKTVLQGFSDMIGIKLFKKWLENNVSEYEKTLNSEPNSKE